MPDDQTLSMYGYANGANAEETYHQLWRMREELFSY